MAIKICLDAGHYGKYNQSPAIPEYYESDMNWKLHLLLKKYLEEYGFTVITTRADKNKDLGLTARGKKAKGCNLFLSLHSNAVGNGVNESVDYPVVYVPINGTGDNLGKKLADCIASVMKTKQKGKAQSRKGSGNWDYYSVIYSAVSVGVPGLILEHSFHTHTRSTKWLLNDNNLDKLARAEAEVIAVHYGVKKPAEEPEHWYRIRKSWKDVVSQIGAYKDLEKAKSGCPEGYTVFDWNGKSVYTNNPKPATYTLTLPVLRKGDRGDTVKALQHLLLSNGIRLAKYGADGDFGNETEVGVKEYQRKVGQEANGVAGPDTVGSLMGV